MNVSPRFLTRQTVLKPVAPSTSNNPKPVENKQDDSFSRNEKQELEYWNDRLRSRMGALTTPPAGPKSEDMEKAQNYVSDLLDRVAGEDISKSGMELRVEIFSGDIPQAGLDDSMSRETRWKRIHDDEEWPIRKWMQTADSSADKPIYRLTVDLGMLRAFESEDELAFVLSHQAEQLLTHAEEDPDNEKTLRPRQSFVDPREMQASTDRAAIKRMADAGYNPRAAFNAISKLFQLNPIEYPHEDLDRALTAAAHGHEAEGLRVGLIQTEVENFVRRGDPTTAKEMTPLPESVKIEARPQYDKPVEDMEAFKANHRALAEKLAGDETPEWMFDSSYGAREHWLIQQAGGDKVDKEEALVDVVDHLDQLEGKTAQQKVDGFLRLVLSLRNSTLPKEPFTDDGLKKIHSFLAKNGSEWNAKTFLDSLNSRGKRQSLHFSFVHYMVYNRNFQDMAGGALPGLGEAVPEAWVTRNYSEPKPHLLTSLVRKNHDEDRETWPLGPEIDKATLKYLASVDPTPMLGETGSSGFSKATDFANELFNLKEPNQDFKKQLLEAGTNLREKAGQSREQKARVRMQLPLKDPQKVNEFLRHLGMTETWKEFSPEFERDFRQQFSDFITISVQQPGFTADPRAASYYSEGLERRVVEIAKESSNPQEGITHLARHLYPSRRIRAHSERRQWLGDAARILASGDYQSQIANPDRSQHAENIKSSLVSCYNLTPEDLPDTSTPSLKALAKRVQEKEFEPKRENYDSSYAYDRAMREYHSARRQLRDVLEPVQTIESRSVLSKIALLGHDHALSESLASQMDLPAFQRVLNGAVDARDRFRATEELYSSGDDEDIGADVGGFLVDGLLAVQDQIESLEQWYEMAETTIDFGDGGLEARVGAKRKLGENLFNRLHGLPQNKLRGWLSKEKPLELMSPEQGSDILLEILGEKCQPGVSPADLAREVERLNKNYKLIDEHPVTYLEFRDKVSEKAKLQPDTVDTVFPETDGISDSNVVYRNQARSLSGLIALARQRSPQEQIDTVEYLMGRQDEIPEYLENASEDQSFAPLRESLETTREDLLESDSETRVMIANSFLAGPSGVLRTEAGKEAVIAHFLKNIKPENRELSDKLARGVLYSHGNADTLAVAYILGQHPTEPKEGEEKGKLDEASILNRLFDAYGVPGIKMKQYLAFTSEFKDFKDAFEDAQDSAMPLNYYQVLKLVQNRFGDEWPQDLKIDRVLGSGSVNVAIRYFNEKEGRREVVSLGRQDIEESTKYDFDRFNKLIEYMTQTPEDKEKYGYILGLLGLINDSVALEFQKEQAMEVQQSAYQTYHHEVNGWKVGSIDAYKVENLGLFMQEAKGKTARKIYQKDKDVYNSAMDAMASAEFGVLRGVDSTNNWRPKPMFANPDFHDGQVLIDEETKSVTILDFGQAVPISNDDRVGGLDLLTIIGKVDSAKAAAKRLNKRYFPDKEVITKELLEPILEREDRMDCFIHLLSALSRSGADVPISSVHWVLGMNRQIALAEKIGDPIDSAVRNMVLNHKAGLPLSTFNASYGGFGSDGEEDGNRGGQAEVETPKPEAVFSMPAPAMEWTLR